MAVQELTFLEMPMPHCRGAGHEGRGLKSRMPVPRLLNVTPTFPGGRQVRGGDVGEVIMKERRVLRTREPLPASTLPDRGLIAHCLQQAENNTVQALPGDPQNSRACTPTP